MTVPDTLSLEFIPSYDSYKERSPSRLRLSADHGRTTWTRTCATNFMILPKPPQFLVVVLPLAGFVVVAAWGILVLPVTTGVKSLVIDGTCGGPDLSMSSSARPYTGVWLLDKQLCILVEILYQAFQPFGLAFTQYFLWGLPPLIMVVLLEGSRSDRPWFFNSLFWGVVYQLWTIGLVLSILWIPFVFAIWRGGGKRHVSPGDAEGALIATLIGYYLPTAVMLTSQSSASIALWQPFPIYISVVQYLWSTGRSKGLFSSPVVGTQPALIITMLTASAVQLYKLYPEFNLLTVSTIREWLPIWSMPSGYILTTQEGVRGVLQYDAFTAYGSSIVAGILMMDSMREALLWLVMAPLGMLWLSPGGYIAAMWIQRERKLTSKKTE